ncbi:3-dehydroquinate synthase [Buchnera aphidicola (Chaitoregma tattakana)]|uniref:3-dehydroquinate synthase n=1 Tax=Buchnera aphidicola TaxID=9 RepID=UPI0031B8B15B
MKIINVKLNGKNCQINIGYNIFSNKNMISYLKVYNNIVLITNVTLYNIYKKTIIFSLRQFKVINNIIILNDGEIYKTFNSIKIIVNNLIKLNYGRDITLMSFGGGVISDITGFAASIYKRGVKYINIPTTLLSQVDASIGGKTGVNNSLSKNVIGTFYHPKCVIIDTMFLKTLPRREFISGLSEVVKYAILFDKTFFYWIKSNLDSILFLDNKVLYDCICRSCKFKIDIICQDEKEKNIRMLLNLGHTFGHAIESFTKYTLLHGEAVSIGIVISSIFSNYLCKISLEQVQEIIDLFNLIGLPVTGPKNMKSKDYFRYMIRDKKNFSNKKIRIIVPNKIGKCVLLDNVDINLLTKIIDNNFLNDVLKYKKI